MWLWALLLRLRYSISVKGAFPKSFKPIIVFGSLSSQIDPLLIASAISAPTRFFQPCETVTMPWLARLYRMLGWRPLTDRENIFSAFALRRYHNELEKIKADIHRGAYLFFPVGHVMLDTETRHPRFPMEKEVIQGLDQPIIVYAQIHGMLGSFFSAKRFGGNSQLTFRQVLWMLIRNGLFFMPRRKITIEWSEKRPDIHRENVCFVPHYWGEKPSEVKSKEEIPPQIFDKIAELSHRESSKIQLTQNLYEDLSLDSLDVTELTVWIKEKFDRYAPFEKLQTVEDVVRSVIGSYQPPDLQIVEEKKRMAWIQKRNPPRAPKGDTILDAFLSVCDEFGSQIACTDHREFMSYQRLKSLAIGLTKSLQSLPGVRVGLMRSSSPQFNIVYLALLMAGKVPCLINWTLGSRHIEEAIELADLKVILSSEPFYEHLKINLPFYIEEKIRFIEEITASLSSADKMASLQLAKQSNDVILRHFGIKANPDSPAVIAFTSGTEKHPKGVVLTHRNILANQRSLFAALDFNEKDVLLGMLPAFHVYGFSFTNLLPILIGCRTVFVPNLLDFSQSAQMAQMWQATIVPTTPTFLTSFLQIAKPEQIQSVRLFSVGAEPCPKTLREKVRELSQNPLLIEGYGVTECSPCLTLQSLKKPSHGVGQPLPGIELAIVDPDTYQPLEKGHSGLVCAYGENVFKGYLGGVPAPWIRLQGRLWYNTGDLGYFDKDGALILEGRLSRTVKIGGELVHLQALEEIVQAQRSPCAIIAQEGDERPRLILFVTQSVDLETANRWLMEAGLSPLVRLAKVHVLKDMPRLASGKIDYRSLE